MALLECTHLSKHYDSLAALDDVTFCVEPGSVLGIGGPNGSGKSTLFDVISGITRPSAGEIRFAGRRISATAPHHIRRRGLARSFQIDGLFAGLNVHEHVLLGASHGHASEWRRWVRHSPAARERAQAALNEVGLAHAAGRFPALLTVLERRLLALAMAMAGTPRMLLLDEPVGGLSREEGEVIRAIVERIVARGVAVVVVEHVLRFLRELAGRVLILHHGRIIFEGPPAGLAHDEAVIEHYLGEHAAARMRSDIDGR